MSGAVIIMRQNALIRRFQEVGAISPSSAQTLAVMGVRESWVFRKMAARRVFLPTEDGRYYMDSAGAGEFVRLRRIRVWKTIAVFLVLFLIVLAFLFYQ